MPRYLSALPLAFAAAVTLSCADAPQPVTQPTAAAVKADEPPLPPAARITTPPPAR